MSCSSCRVCRGAYIRMVRIENLKLLEMYEKITGKKFSTDDGRPQTLCYICHMQLQKCCRFADMANRSEMILTDLLSKGMQVKHKTVTLKDHSLTHNMSMRPLQFLMLTDKPSVAEDSPRVTVKIERYIEKTTDTDYAFIEVEDSDGKEEFTNIEYGTGTKMTVNSEYDDTHVRTAEECEFIEFEDSTSISSVVENEFDGSSYIKGNDNFIESQDRISVPEVADLDSRESSLNPTKHSYVYCDYCNKKFAYKFCLVAHLMLHAKKQSHSNNLEKHGCDKCTEEFETEYELKIHMKTHVAIDETSSGETFTCKICDEAFPTKLKLTTHILTHSEEWLPPPKESSKAFKKPVKVFNHYFCHKCNIDFNKLDSYEIHLQNHMENKFVCETCSKVFPSPGRLNGHMKIHTVHKYVCKTCSKTFASLHGLKRHEQIHNKERPSFPCHSCNKFYSYKHHLMDHLKTHNGVRPHTCKICDRTFTYRATLRSHMVTHTGEKPHACTKCDAAFSQSGTLKRHMRLLHPVK